MLDLKNMRYPQSFCFYKAEYHLNGLKTKGWALLSYAESGAQKVLINVKYNKDK